MSIRSVLFGAVNGAAPQRRSTARAAARDEVTALAGLSRAPRSWAGTVSSAARTGRSCDSHLGTSARGRGASGAATAAARR
eukprot:7262628-Alexandrium_andersonii.AAC.1